MSALRLGTRASALATTQSEWVADLIRQRLGRDVELVEVTTEGDVNRAPLAAMAHTLSRNESGYDIGVAHADGPEMLKAAIHDFIEARMKPEVERHAHTEATVEATKSGLSHAMRALKPPSRWKTPEST